MTTLADRYAGVVLDIDGVVVLDDAALPDAGATVAALRAAGLGLQLATNNASRTPAEIASFLQVVGVDVDASEVLTSALVAAEMLEPGTACLVIGMGGLRGALEARGCRAVHDPAEAEAVVVGWDRDLVWDDLRRATMALAGGARFVATNTDASYPTAQGPWPGNGATVAALAAASGRTPEVAGKPQPAMFDAAARRLGGPLLMVGDRHETDIAGAAACGWDTALVLTGVTPVGALEALDPAPTYVLEDIRGLLDLPAPTSSGAGAAVRTARDTDVDPALALWTEAGMLGYTPDPLGDIAGVRSRDPDLFLVAEREGRVVGVLLGSTDGRRGWLHRLAVTAEDRRAGIGGALVAEAERRMARRGLSQINLLHFGDNLDAAEFWERQGYGATGPTTLRTKRLP
jgi:glycerol-1-phosphatase